MTKIAQSIDDLRTMADEVARLMALRFGGVRRGEAPGLATMLRRRGGALPRKLRGQARLLAEADAQIAQPRVALQMDLIRPSRAYNALMMYLKPLGGVSRWQNRAVNFGASVAFGLLVLAAVVIWMMVLRGHL